MIETTLESNGTRMVMNGTIFRGPCTDQSIKPSDRLCTPPLHSHPDQDETFEVVEGFFEYILENTTGIITTGQKILVPKGTLHSFSTPKDQTLKLIISFFPGMKMEEFFEQNVGIRKDSDNTGWFFGYIEGVLHMKRFEGNELIQNRPGPFVNFVCNFLATLIGIKDYIPEYHQLNK